jgi:antitoxin ParD1/3/4
MNLHLTPELEKLILNELDSGRYSSANEVVGEALRLLEQRDRNVEVYKDEIRIRVEEGWQSAQLGEFVEGDELFDRLDGELSALEQSARK